MLEQQPKRAFKLLASLVAVFTLLVMFLYIYGGTQLNSRLEHELKLARTEGLPVTDEDIAKTNPRIPDSQNAALIYAKIKPVPYLIISSKFYKSENGSFTPEDVAQVQKIIASGKETFDLLERAAKLEGCWTDLRHEDPDMSTVINYSIFRNAYIMLLIRGAYAKWEGRNQDVLADYKRLDRIKEHLYMMKDPRAFDLHHEITEGQVEYLAAWAMVEPPESIWHKELNSLIENYTPPSNKQLAWLILSTDKYVFDSLSSRKSRAERLGIKDSEESSISFMDHAKYIGKSPKGGFFQVVKGRRLYWAEVTGPGKPNPAIIEESHKLIEEGYLSSPWLATYNSFTYHKEVLDEDYFKAEKLVWQAAYRFLAQKNRTIAPDLSGLSSPYDGKEPEVDFARDRVLFSVIGPGRNQKPGTFVLDLAAKS